nr:MAG TPA: hypothetical protein [Caudoviricetes sp.]
MLYYCHLQNNAARYSQLSLFCPQLNQMPQYLIQIYRRGQL